MKHRIAIYSNGYNGSISLKAIEGIKKYAAIKDFDTHFYIGFAASNEKPTFNIGQFNIYQLAKLEEYDGLIVFSGILNNPALAERCCREAKEKGFVDELIEDAEPLSIAASADGRSIFVHGRTMHLTPGMFAPDVIPTVTPDEASPVEAYNETPAVTGEEEGGIPMTIDELRAQYPEEIGQIEADARAAVDSTEAVNAAVQAERTRMQEIDAVAALYPADMVQAAKYGDHPCSAQEMTYRAAQAAAQAGRTFLADASDDAEKSGTGNVKACPGNDDDVAEANTPEARMENARSSVKGLFKKEE